MSSKVWMLAVWTAAALMPAQPAAAQRIDRDRLRTQLPAADIMLLAQQSAAGDVTVEQWVRRYTQTSPAQVRFRWSTTLETAKGGEWQVSRSHDDFSAPLARGILPAPEAGESADFHIDFRPIVGNAPLPQTYWVRVVVYTGGISRKPGAPVRIDFVRGETIRFTTAGLYPELFRPMPIYVDMYRLEIVEADEEGDEEPYIIPVVIYFDGTTVDVLDRASSTVRVATSRRQDVHGNIPRYNGSLGAGSRIAVPEDVGYFESTILPLNLDLADLNLGDFNVDWTHLVQATTVWVGVLAMEQDNTSTAAANAARDAVVQGLRAEFENCLREMTFADVIRLIEDGQNLDAVLKRDDGSACGYTATEDDGTVLDQIRAKLTDLAVETAKAEELDDIKHKLPGGGLFLLHQITNPDDVVVFAYRSFTYEELMNASGPIRFTLDLDKIAPPSFPRAARKQIRYRVDVAIGRCEQVPNRPRCVPTTKPLLP